MLLGTKKLKGAAKRRPGLVNVHNKSLTEKIDSVAAVQLILFPHMSDGSSFSESSDTINVYVNIMHDLK